MMEEFAEYILNEEDLIAKEEIIYFLAPKLGINFDKATIFKTEIARMFLKYTKIRLDNNLILTACLLCNCKKVDDAQKLGKVQTYAIEGAQLLKKLGHNITNIQMFILGYIYENQNNKDIYQKYIEKLLNIRRSTTTEILNVMEKKDFVKRIESPSDKRQKIIVLSKKGKYYVGEFEKFIFIVEKEILKDISNEEKDNFFCVLEKIKKNLDSL